MQKRSRGRLVRGGDLYYIGWALKRETGEAPFSDAVVLAVGRRGNRTPLGRWGGVQYLKKGKPRIKIRKREREWVSVYDQVLFGCDTTQETVR